MQGVRLCSFTDQAESPHANWSVWLEGGPRTGHCSETPVRRLLAYGSLAVDSSLSGPREGGPKKKIEVRIREFQSFFFFFFICGGFCHTLK